MRHVIHQPHAYIIGAPTHKSKDFFFFLLLLAYCTKLLLFRKNCIFIVFAYFLILLYFNVLKSKPADFGGWTTANEPVRLFQSALSFVCVACTVGGGYLVGSRALGAQHMYVAHIAQIKQLDPGGIFREKIFLFM